MTTTHTVSAVLRTAAGATLLIGLITLLAPEVIVRIFDGYDPSNYHFVRFIGTALIGFAVTNWLYSSFEDMKVVLPAIYGNVTSLVLGVAVDVIGLIAGVLSLAAWWILLLHTIFLALFAWCIRLIRASEAL
jgi:hypothetical protein